jgi:hypothetical protein
MAKSFSIHFDGPENGWIRVVINSGGEAIDVTASYVPYDTITEVAEGLSTLLDGQDIAEVRINEEPAEYLLRMTRLGETLRFEQLHLTVQSQPPVAVLEAPLNTALRVMARILNFLYEDSGYDKFVEHWHHRPPRAAIQHAWSYFCR